MKGIKGQVSLNRQLCTLVVVAGLAGAITALSSCESISKARHPSAAQTARGQELVIKAGEQVLRFSLEELSRSPHLRTVEVTQDPAYGGRKMTYKAVPVAELFRGLKFNAAGTALFSCLDGFSGPLSISRLIDQGPKSSIAYIAVESKESPWPALKPGSSVTAGPFYLIWEHPERSRIQREEWPFQLASLEVKKESVEAQFPKTAPASNISANSPVRKGYLVFQRNCFFCHKINGEGQSEIGPDLNLPYGPTEYMKLSHLERLIRDPQTLRKWPQARMPGFNSKEISDAEMEHLIAYLQHMSKGKR
ncbi:MAG: cytochrome c [Bdellovibrionales bacterium]